VTPLVVALAGTDHHPFDRLVTWVDAAAARRPDVRFLVQHGSATRPPVLAEGQEFFTHDRLTALLSEATAVICHGGPGTIMDAREAGHVPLCVPRDPGLGEHVDGHQQRFAAMVAQSGVAYAVATLEEFHDRLDQALDQTPSQSALTMATRARDTARARLAVELDELIAVRPHRLARRHRAAL
jgi:UDP-N-acetylglucosamine transferase subunit ALG13